MIVLPPEACIKVIKVRSHPMRYAAVPCGAASQRIRCERTFTHLNVRLFVRSVTFRLET